ncbi:MAG: sulfate/thiosulfate transport system permease protein, partial [Solirubrobacteraceae bacterium]|nr:sulfate/thiosulfate transport system permease protein [Solirubrobacteraceae bacterium]
IVLIPLAALVSRSFEGGTGKFWDAATSDTALRTLRFTVEVSLVVAAINVVAGLLLALVLVRDEFPGKRVVNALIDLPFALPTIVAGLTLIALYGGQDPLNIDIRGTQAGIALALLFVTLPFVVRSAQPVLIELDREMEEAAVSLGATPWTTFRRIIFPNLVPALLSGAALAFARAVGEFGSIVLISSANPHDTETSAITIFKLNESDAPISAAAVSVVLLTVSLVVLILIRALERWGGGSHAG